MKTFFKINCRKKCGVFKSGKQNEDENRREENKNYNKYNSKYYQR